ncbi:MAG: hypothetical protein ACI9LX_002170 [Paraglaciecola sp.]|jgi:hypothetical protein
MKVMWVIIVDMDRNGDNLIYHPCIIPQAEIVELKVNVFVGNNVTNLCFAGPTKPK